jgi:hypothetical protein
VQRVPIGRTLLIAAACALIPLAGNIAATFLTDWSGVRSWLVVPAVGVIVAMVTALIQAYGSGSSQASPAREVSVYRGREGGGAPVAVVLLIALIVIGVGGWGVAEGARYVVGYITGKEPGTDRLVKPVGTVMSGVKLVVESVTYTDHFTRVGLRVRNLGSTPVTLPVYGNCTLTGLDGTTLDADPDRSEWTENVPPSVKQRGTVTFDGHLPDSVKRASFSFTDVFRFGPGGGSITVHGIQLEHARPAGGG